MGVRVVTFLMLGVESVFVSLDIVVILLWQLTYITLEHRLFLNHHYFIGDILGNIRSIFPLTSFVTP